MFKAKSLGLFEEVARTGQSIMVTKRGKPIAEVVPVEKEKERPIPGQLAGTVLFEGDILTPFGAEIWHAAQSEPFFPSEDSDKESAKKSK